MEQHPEPGPESRAVADDENEEVDLDSWQDSLPLSDEDFTPDNRLVKSKVDKIKCPRIFFQCFISGNVRSFKVHDRNGFRGRV